MKPFIALLLTSLCVLALPSIANDDIKIDLVGVATNDGSGFQVSFGDVCTLSMRVDREYKVLAARMKGWPKVVGYTLAPSDGNSALSVGFGEPKAVRSDDEIAKSPGFTKIVRKSISVGGTEVVFRRWQDAQHLYGDAVAHLDVDGAKPRRKITVIFSIVANSEERRVALETALASLKLKEPNSERSAAP